ncbi:MAG TPA: three-Cys-motif partner protein TcmP [Cyclobacteriaceae bacterium]
MTSNTFSSPTNFFDDGFSITATEPWFKVKVQLIQNYLFSFVTNAVSRVDEIVVVDLFAGSGLYSLGHQKEIFAGTCLASLQSSLPINKWVFCESNAEQAKALKIRVNKYFREKNVLILDAEKEALVDKLRLYIPASKSSYKVAVCCLVDPFSLDVSFSLLGKLASMGYSFIVPFTFSLNERHDYQYYIKENAELLRKFMGSDASRLQSSQTNFHFYKSLVKGFQQSMLMQGLNGSLSVHKLNSKLMDVPMFYIGYFSRQISPKLIHHDVNAVEQVQFQLF